jgi:DNA polymerase (family 10)
MDNDEIATVFRGIADLLEKRKDGWFKIRAYRGAADSIDALAVPAEQLRDQNRLREIPGVGEAIAKKIAELVSTGRLEYYERLKAESSEDTG